MSDRRRRNKRSQKLRAALSEDVRWDNLPSTYYRGQHRSQLRRLHRERWEEWSRYLAWRIGHHAGRLFAMRELAS